MLKLSWCLSLSPSTFLRQRLFITEVSSLMILHLLQDGIRLKVEFVRCNPNYNICLVGTPGRPMVWVMWLADLFPSLTVVNLVHPIYTSCKPHGKSGPLIVFPASFHYSEDRRLAPVVFSCKGFPCKNCISCLILFSHYLLTFTKITHLPPAT